MTRIPGLLGLVLVPSLLVAQASQPEVHSGSPLQPQYPVPYQATTEAEVTRVVTRVLEYQETANPAGATDPATRN